MTDPSLEQRVSQIEREIVRLKLRSKPGSDKSKWVSELIGTAKDDPDYAEIARLGKEIRDAEEQPEEQ